MVVSVYNIIFWEVEGGGSLFPGYHGQNINPLSQKKKKKKTKKPKTHKITKTTKQQT
jgi:hypothetical protein